MSLLLRKGAEMKKIVIRDKKTQEALMDFEFDDQDKTVLPRFRQGLKQLHRLERAEKQGIRRALAGHVKSNHIAEHSREQEEMRKQAAEIFEGLLGAGAVRKIYASAYEADPYFMPSVKLLADALESIICQIKQFI